MKRIIIDVGHADGTGARGCGLEEHEQARLLAEAVRREAEAAGFDVVVVDYATRSNRDDLNMTIEAANAMGADLGVSLHFDAAESTAARGAHVCFLSATGQRAAACIAGRLCALLPGRANATVRRPDLAVLKRTRSPWVLCECGFITNRDDMALVSARRADVAGAIVQGLCEFFDR